ncbi:MAG: pyridoxamine 5'-phosphate oxidase family protein [Actinomycetota bacterium]
MATISDLRAMAASETGLCVVATTRADGSVHASVVNAGVMGHPVTGVDCVAFVARGSATKLRLLRASGRCSVTFRRGWQWAGAEGEVDVIDRDRPPEGVDYRQLLRDVFTGAGGTHDDWDAYDKVMVNEERTAVFVRVDRVIGNG